MWWYLFKLVDFLEHTLIKFDDLNYVLKKCVVFYIAKTFQDLCKTISFKRIFHNKYATAVSEQNSIFQEFNTRIYMYENIIRRMVGFVRVLPHDIKNMSDREKNWEVSISIIMTDANRKNKVFLFVTKCI